MKNELKSALVMGIILLVAIGGASAYFSSLEPQMQNQFDKSVQTQGKETSKISNIDKSRFKKAPELIGISGYINTTPEELKAAMKDKVILYDFWTYSCINCIRTLPYITAWNSKYTDKGLLIIGVHSPEFEFEKDFHNVQTAVKQYNITYPVVQDNEMKTWKAFDNRYWPRKYITDSEGYIRYDHIGEGGYIETEKIIQDLLQERSQLLGLKIVSSQPLVDLEEHQFTAEQTPELYFGYSFALSRNYLGNPEGFKPDNVVTYALPEKRSLNNFYLEGQWQNFDDRMKLVSENGKIVLPYLAQSVNIVAANESELQILLDGKPIATEDEGMDVKNGSVHISNNNLYNLVSSKEADQHTLTIVAKQGFEIYTFTFG